MTRERPILMSGPMVRALLAGAKTQTRRVAQPKRSIEPMTDECPYGQPGDTLWVREAWAAQHACDHLKPSEMRTADTRVHYAATEDLGGLRKRPGMFMPRWASRITLRVTDVRVERLQDISEADAVAEGIGPHRKGGWWWEQPPDGIAGSNHFGAKTARDAFRALWESINGGGSWDENPWVWVVSFERAAAALAGKE